MSADSTDWLMDKFRKWQEVTGMTQADLAGRLQSSTGREWDQSKVSRYLHTPDEAPFWAVEAILRELGEDIGSFGRDRVPPQPPRVDVGRPLADIRRDLQMLSDYIVKRDWSSPDPAVEVPDVAELTALCRQLGRKPRVAFFGRFDVGKSTLVNTILGLPAMPTSYQPATRTITYVRHVSDRPEWMEHDVAVLGRGFDPERWDDEHHCRAHVLVQGDIQVLQEHGSHKGSGKDAGAETALVFLDAPVLNACTFIDLPGTENSTEDTDKATAAEVMFDIAVFADTTAGFLSEGVLLRLGDVVRRLPPVEAIDSSVGPLRNLYIVATHAHAGVTDEQLEGEVFAGGRTRAWRQLGATALVARSRETGVPVTEAAFASRFFAFYREAPDRSRRLMDDLSELLESTMPSLMRTRADSALARYQAESDEQLRQAIDFYARVRDDRQAVQEEYESLLQQEPQRKRAVAFARKAVNAAIGQHRAEMVAQVDRHISEATSPAAIEELIKEHFESRKDAQQNAPALVLERIQDFVEGEIRTRTEEVTKLIEEFIGEYSQASLRGPAHPEGVRVPFNAKGAFAGGLVGLASVGGLALWASTLGNLGAYIIVAKTVSVLSAIGISTGGTAAWASVVAAIGGPVTIAIGIVVLTAVLGWALLRGSWEGRLAKKISSVLAERDIPGTYRANINNYWHDTSTAFERGGDNAEAVWQEHLDSLGRIVAESDLEQLDAWLSRLQELRDFHRGIPWQRVVRLRAIG